MSDGLHLTHWNATAAEIAQALREAPESTHMGYFPRTDGTKHVVLYSKNPPTLLRRISLFMAKCFHSDSVVFDKDSYSHLSGSAILDPAKLKIVNEVFVNALNPEAATKEKEREKIQYAQRYVGQVKQMVQKSHAEFRSIDKSTCLRDTPIRFHNLTITVHQTGREQEETLLDLDIPEHQADFIRLLKMLGVPEEYTRSLSPSKSFEENFASLRESLDRHLDDRRLDVFFSFLFSMGQQQTAPLTTLLTEVCSQQQLGSVNPRAMPKEEKNQKPLTRAALSLTRQGTLQSAQISQTMQYEFFEPVTDQTERHPEVVVALPITQTTHIDCRSPILVGDCTFSAQRFIEPGREGVKPSRLSSEQRRAFSLLQLALQPSSSPEKPLFSELPAEIQALKINERAALEQEKDTRAGSGLF